MEYNNTGIEGVVYNNTELDKVIYNGVEVFSKNSWDGIIVSNGVLIPNPDFFSYSGSNSLYVNYNGTAYFVVNIKDISPFSNIIFSASGSTSFADHGWGGATYVCGTLSGNLSSGMDISNFKNYSKEMTLTFKCQSDNWHGNVATYKVNTLYLQ